MKAFPSQGSLVMGDTTIYGDGGMDLRDYFAAKVLQGIMSLPPIELYRAFESSDLPLSEAVAKQAYGFSDAMMKAREQ